MSDRYPKFSSRLFGVVKNAGLNNKQFAEIINISANAATNYLKKGRLPEPDILVRISIQFEKSIDWLLQDVFEPMGQYDHATADIDGFVGEPIPKYKSMLDVELLRDIISAIEKGLARAGLELKPGHKAEAVALLYELYYDSGKKVEEETIKRYLKLAS